ncbi:SDR family NAD(P)-dependent oxidoreductase [Streptomyces sp. NPDC006733]|uniref:SDR family NAD(P)-dependent oxidoreductase n=1 Tax=Streptomyces sp. NPDC006733 TaxID=3155460 RepID=UPI0033E80ECC
MQVPNVPSSGRGRAVAVVGLGAVAPGASSPEEVWQVLCQDKPQYRLPVRFDIEPIYSPQSEAADRTFGRTAGYIDDIELHPALADEVARGWWGADSTEALWLRHSLLQTLDTCAPGPGDRTGFYVATWSGATQAAEETVLSHVVARRMAEYLGGDALSRAAHEHRVRTLLRRRYRCAMDRPRDAQPDMVLRRAASGLLPDDTDWLAVTAACASSLYAFDLGIQSLLAGDCTVAYCGAVNGMGRLMAVSAAKFESLSAHGDVRAFDAAADGTLFSEAATMAALKTLERAERDGDRILAVVQSTGLACDGRGKAISAPNPAGVRRAVMRAWAAAGAGADDIDWVVAHGTGTLAGDKAEIDTLAALSGESRLLCTSNKSLLGHSAWAAGGLSLIHAVKALEHEVIPAQRRFDTPHPALAGTSVHIPTGPVPWPSRPGRPRIVGINGLGVGGVNAHVVVSDRPPADPVRASVSDETLVLTAWSAQLPGCPGPEAVRHWLATDEEPPPHGFGDSYPAPAFAATRLPPVVTQVIDRAHLMALDAAHRFVTEHGEIWDGLRETTGIVAGQGGPTRSWIDVTLRAASGDLESIDWDERDRSALQDFLAQVSSRQQITDESLTGNVPQLAAYRIAHRWDLHGPCLSVDAGDASALSAVHVALRQLRSGIVDLALVLSVNESRTAEAADFTGHREHELAEGAFLLAFTREALARERGWPVVARITAERTAAPATTPPRPSTSRDFAAAQGAVDILRASVRGERMELVSASPPVRVTVNEPETEEGSPQATQEETGEPAKTAAAESGTSRWATIPRRTDARPPDSLLADSLLADVPEASVLLVNTAHLARELAQTARQAGALLLSTDPSTAPWHATVVAADPTESTLSALLNRRPGLTPHLRVFLSTRSPDRGWWAEDPRVTRLLDLTFLTCKHLGSRLTEGSVVLTVLDPLIDFQPHPDGAQFTGYLRSLTWEIPQQRAFALVTDASLPQALKELASEGAAHRDAPVIFYRGGLRHTEQLIPAALPIPAGDQPVAGLGTEPVVVAVGGARGITSVAVRELARRHHPVLWLLGRSDPADVPPEILDADESSQAGLRAAHITYGRLRTPQPSVAELNQEFDRHWRAREAAATLADLRTLCGPRGRVHYRVCDVTNPAAVAAVVSEIYQHHERVDLLLNSAFCQESARIVGKSLEAFRRVVATKVRGYRNLRAAFASAPPQLWCNFGSSIVLFGFSGETDYAAGSEFLAAAARYDSRLLHSPAVTIGWGLWEESGSVSGAQAREHLTRTGVKTGISNAQGAAFFLSELAHPGSAEPAPVYTTSHDRELADQRTPGFTAQPTPQRPAPNLLGDPTAVHDGETTWNWSVSPDTDRYLLEHLIDGRPVVPGMHLVALAAQAARQIVPGLPVHTVRDIQLQEFVWADPRETTATKYRFVAKAVAPSRGAAGGRRRTVHVRVLSDIRARDGKLLSADRCHAAMDVVLGPSEPAPLWTNWKMDDVVRLADPCCRTGSRIQLTGVFRNVVSIQAEAARASGRFQPLLAPQDGFSRTPLPVLLLDSLGRTTCFPLDDTGRTSVHAPTGIDRIDVFLSTSDADLAARYPEGIDLYGEPTISRYTAVAPDGSVIARISGLHRHPFGTLPALLLPDTPDQGPRAERSTHT